jgi:hypothetical protein
MKKYFSIVLLVGLFTCSCATQKSWVYSTNNYNYAPVLANKSAVILPFKDSRENINKNMAMMYLIPIYPSYGWMDYNVPEGPSMHLSSRMWTNYKPSEDYPKALAKELTSAGIFKEVYFAFRKGDSDFVIKGEILSTKYTGSMRAYGLSAYGPLLWFIGFPAGVVTNELEIKLSCVENNSKNVIFSKTYTAPKYKKTAWIYALPNDFNYPSMLKSFYKDFTEDLKINLQKQARIETRN